jgi:Zn-finger nucleic acid-binding protein
MLPVCPKCDIQLFTLIFQNVELDCCYKCRGVWLDTGEIEAICRNTGAMPDDTLLQALEANGEIVQNRRQYLCPRCDTAMRQATLVCPGENASLVLETCANNHGVWFDDHELQRLLSLFSSECGTSRTIEFLNDFFGTGIEKANPAED